MHDHGIVHGDVKVLNILVSADLKQVKICDFGIARIKRTVMATMSSTIKATALFCAPETVRSGVVPNMQTDIWQAGCVVVEMYLQRSLWDEPPAGVTHDFFITSCMEKKLEPHGLAELFKFDPTVCTKAEKCFSYDPALRPSAQELYEAWSES